MNIGLIDVDSHSGFPNLALMKIARYHAEQGDHVEWYNNLCQYDKVYMSKVFTFTKDYRYIIDADEIVRGGTGYNVDNKLPDEIDRLQPLYSIYPQIDKRTAYGFLTRGCIRKCPWCIVPKKEGAIAPYMDIEEIAIDGRSKIVLLDNNLIASGDYAVEQLNKIIAKGYRIDLNQANDARLVDDDMAKILAKVKWIDGVIRFGCDTPKQVEDCDRAIHLLLKHGFHGDILLYTMLHGDIRECYDRIMHFKDYHADGIRTKCQAQPMLDLTSHTHHIPQWQKDMAHWANQRMLFHSCDFKDFSPRKGFTCKEYFQQ